MKPAPPKKPWNDTVPLQLPRNMVSRWGVLDFVHPHHPPMCFLPASRFFPLRGGGGAVGGMLGAFKKDTLIDLEFGSPFVTKPMKDTGPGRREEGV